jgi:ABC-type protease/lipase transport system fused ATPase/permease subunit
VYWEIVVEGDVIIILLGLIMLIMLHVFCMVFGSFSFYLILMLPCFDVSIFFFSFLIKYVFFV